MSQEPRAKPGRLRPTQWAVFRLSPALLLAIQLLTGGAQGAEPEDPPRPPPSEAPPPKPLPVKKAEAIAEEVDLTADKPEAAAKSKDAPLLNALEPPRPVGETAGRCYKLLAEMKTQVEQISADLDKGGKEVTRLIRCSDTLAKNITDLANIWPTDESFRDMCGSAKRRALVLNEELSQVPRKWTHVRWSFTSALQEVSKLRLRARDLAEAEPKPVALLGKDGKPVLDKEGRQVFVDAPKPPPDPVVVKREKNLRDLQAQRDRLRKIEEEKKNPPIKTGLDGD